MNTVRFSLFLMALLSVALPLARAHQPHGKPGRAPAPISAIIGDKQLNGTGIDGQLNTSAIAAPPVSTLETAEEAGEDKPWEVLYDGEPLPLPQPIHPAMLDPRIAEKLGHFLDKIIEKLSQNDEDSAPGLDPLVSIDMSSNWTYEVVDTDSGTFTNGTAVNGTIAAVNGTNASPHEEETILPEEEAPSVDVKKPLKKNAAAVHKDAFTGKPAETETDNEKTDNGNDDQDFDFDGDLGLDDQNY
jgi:hypothetical protein